MARGISKSQNSVPRWPKCLQNCTENEKNIPPWSTPSTTLLTPLLYLNLPPSRRSPWVAKQANRRLPAGGASNSANSNTGLAHRLRQEAAVLCQLSHPNIIGFRGLLMREADVGDGSSSSGMGVASALLMQFGGRSLLDVIEERRDACPSAPEPPPFAPAFIASAVKQAASALAYLHTERRLMHGDVKSANMLLLAGEGRLRLCDFGSALPLDERFEATAGAAAAFDDRPQRQGGAGVAVATTPLVEFRGTELWAAPEVDVFS